MVIIQDFKEFTDAEGLVSIPTSDLHHPTVCMQFHKYKCVTNSLSPSYYDAVSTNAIAPSSGFSTITLPIETPLRLATLSNNNSNFNNNNNNANSSINNNSGDLASVDSSDTYASCQTHPFPSQGDLTIDLADISCDLDDLYMDNFGSNPFDRTRMANNNRNDPFARSNVKRSASGDGALHSLGVTQPLELCQAFQSFDSASGIHRGSEVSLNEIPVPKHRKTRFQQSSFNRLKGRLSEGSTQKKLSQDSLPEATTSAAACSTMPTSKKNRRASFMPSKSLASATKLINQHLFGIQNNALKVKGTVSPPAISIFIH